MKIHIYLKISIALFIAVLICEVAIYSPPQLQKGPSFNVESVNKEDNSISVEYTISSGGYPIDVQVVFLSGEKVEPKLVYFYYDPDYQLAEVTAKQIDVLLTQLIYNLEVRSYDAEVKVINAEELRQLVLNNETAANSILVVATGALPDTVYTREFNLVKPWVENGGTLHWITSQFGYYSAEKCSEKINFTAPRHPRDEGADKFLNIEKALVYNPRGTMATIKSRYSQALSITYASIFVPLSLSTISKLHGKILGLMDMTDGKESASIASVSVGKGVVVVWGGETTTRGYLQVARDLAQIICSDIVEKERLIGYKSYHLEENQKVPDKYKFDIINPEAEKELTIYVFPLDPLGVFYDKKRLSLIK
jgi:hypothetical protein